MTLTRTLQATWAAGTLVSLLILIVGLSRLAWLASQATSLAEGRWPDMANHVAKQCGLRRSVRILLSAHPTMLVTWGILRPKILLPANAFEWQDDRLRVVLAHELAHVRRGDWLAQMLAEALRAAFWFNPFLWIACRRLRLESEQACDDEVLGLGVDGPSYATHLLDLVRAARTHRRSLLSGYPAPAMARPSSLERRVTAMLNEHVNRNRPSRSTRLSTAAALAAGAIGVAGFGIAAQTFATLSGSVTDPMNNLIPKVTLILTNEQTQAKHEVRSDESGRFEFVGVPAGSYLLEAQYPGFMTLKGRLTVTGQNVERNLSLQVGSVQESITVAGDRTSPDDPATAVVDASRAVRKLAECVPSSAGGNIRPPMKIRDVRPRYPLYLRSAGVSGVVVMQGRIAGDGSVADLKELVPSNPDLTDIAMEAVRQWRFAATLLNCVPVDVEMKVTVRFELR
jgi:TonB family protein